MLHEHTFKFFVESLRLLIPHIGLYMNMEMFSLHIALNLQSNIFIQFSSNGKGDVSGYIFLAWIKQAHMIFLTVSSPCLMMVMNFPMFS